MREVAAEFERPVLLYSIGKDSSCLLRLAQKAFHPAKIPFPLMHVDTGYKFTEMYEFRDRYVKEIGADLIVWRNEPAIAAGANPFDLGTQKCCGFLKTEALLTGLRHHRFDAAIGGARRDEEKSRAKERFFSFRDQFGQWDPKNQRPSCGTSTTRASTPRSRSGSSRCRTGPSSTSGSTSTSSRSPSIPSTSPGEREAVVRKGQIIVLDHVFGRGERYGPAPGEQSSRSSAGFRSLGCVPCSGAIRSTASSIEEIVEEMMVARTSERGTRVIDHDSDGSMEKKKREGYF